MYLEISEEEAHLLILKGLGLEMDADVKKRGDLHVLQSPHAIRIHDYGEAGSIFREPLSPNRSRTCGPNCTCTPATEEISDDCFVVDGIPDLTGQEFEEDLDGT